MSGNVKWTTRQYTKDYKIEAVTLVREIRNTKASKELGVPIILYGKEVVIYGEICISGNFYSWR